MSEKSARRKTRFLPRYAKIFLSIAALSLLLSLLFRISPRFSAAFNEKVAAFFRAALAKVTSVFPFSLAEIFVFMIPLIVIGIGIYAGRKKCDSWKSVFRYLLCLVSVFSLFFSLFVFTFSAGYHTETIDRRMGIDTRNITVADLTATARKLALLTNEASLSVTYGENGASCMPYTLDGLNERLQTACRSVSATYPFVCKTESRIKPVLSGRALSYTHITGLYSYFTGEANVNTYFPDYTIPYTAAHELAHQRGIARENEANFVAYLVTAACDDPYVRYSGYLNLFEYVIDALYGVDSNACNEVIALLNSDVRGELRAYREFFEPFRNTAAASVSDGINDFYLKLHGDAAGMESYGSVVDLVVAYFR